jgi:hypothetical protein
MPQLNIYLRKYTNSQVYKKGKNDECLKRRFLWLFWLFVRELQAGPSKACFEGPAEGFIIVANLCPARPAQQTACKD